MSGLLYVLLWLVGIFFCFLIAIALVVVGIVLRKKSRVATIILSVLGFLFSLPTIFASVLFFSAMGELRKQYKEAAAQYGELNAALKYDNLKKARRLIDKGYDIEIRDDYGNTALLLACRRARDDKGRDVINALLERNADVTACNNHGRTVLHFIVYKPVEEELELVRIFLERGADVNAQEEEGENALMRAVYRSSDIDVSEKIVDLLLEYGARLDLKNKYGKTVLDIIDDEIEEVQERYFEDDKEKNIMALTALKEKLQAEAGKPKLKP